VPIAIFDVIVNLLQGAANLFKSEQLEDAAEFGRIGRYYAIEDMLTTDPAERYGRTKLREHYERIANEGQDYDPYTTLFGSQQGKEEFAAATKSEE
jgi:divinyl chlorophyllide a 8-vinyl-reductase